MEQHKIGPQPNITSRIEQKQTIHQLVEQSKEADLKAAQPETGTNTHHNEHHEIQSWTKSEAATNRSKHFTVSNTKASENEEQLTAE